MDSSIILREKEAGKNMIRVDNVSKSYGDKRVLNNVSCEFEDGKIYCIMGESGVGKTTLIRLIMGLEKPDEGYISSSKQFAAAFQEDRLLEDRDAVDNVMFVLKNGGSKSREQTEQYLSELLPEDRLHIRVDSLSGGMRRRVAVARAMLSDRNTIILDEPFTGLDDETKKTVINFIKKWQNNRTVIVVTHNLEIVKVMKKRVITVKKGTIVSDSKEGGYDDEN